MLKYQKLWKKTTSILDSASFFITEPSRAAAFRSHQLLLPSSKAACRVSRWTCHQVLPSTPRPPHRPSIPVLDRAGGHDEWFIPPARKQLTHRCIPAPYFQSVQKLNGFTNSPILSQAIAAVCCSICKIRKMSIEMHRYTVWEEAVLAESSLYAAVNSVQAAWPDRLLKCHLKSSGR